MIAITLGDPAGVGPEVLLKSLPRFKKYFKRFVILGDLKVLETRAKLLGLDRPRGIEIFPLSSLNIAPGKPTLDGYRAMLSYLEKGIALAKEGKLKALVTLPISKEGLAQIGSPFRGHTELLASAFGVKDYAMTFYGRKLIVSLLTTHLPLKEVPQAIKGDRIVAVAKLSYEFLRRIKPHEETYRIALCGLNPHAGEGGFLGREELEVLRPALEQVRLNDIPLYGPFPADSLFYQALQGKYHLVIALYHDQGLIPFKLLHFKDGINISLGLPIVRTSPCHGTAYDIAAKGLAEPESTIQAIRLALKMCSFC